MECLEISERLDCLSQTPVEDRRLRDSAVVGLTTNNNFLFSPFLLVITPTKAERTKAIGFIVNKGKYGGAFAHKDIAFHFAMWLSPEFQIYLIKEFQRLKEEESNRQHLEWNLQRTLSKINYHIHTDAVKQNLIPKEITKSQAFGVYASEADMLNLALFGKTAAQWKKEEGNQEGNIRDYATLEQLVVLTNLESLNAVFIQQGMTQEERLIKLNKIAIVQITILLRHKVSERVV